MLTVEQVKEIADEVFCDNCRDGLEDCSVCIFWIRTEEFFLSLERISNINDIESA